MAVNLHAKKHLLIRNKPNPITSGAANSVVKDDAYADGRVATETIKESRRRNNQKIHFSWLLDLLDLTSFLCTKKVLDMHKPEKFKIEKITNLPIGSPKVV